MNRDPETECWSAHDAAKDIDDLALRLKALELIVKIRVQGQKVKGDDEEGKNTRQGVSPDDLRKIRNSINGKA